MQIKRFDNALVALQPETPSAFMISDMTSFATASFTTVNRMNFFSGVAICHDFLTFFLVLIRNELIWWHISATRYEIAIMIILENYRDKTNFPGNSIEIAKCFMIEISRYFLTVIQFCFTLVPPIDIHDIYNKIGFRIIFAILYREKTSELSKWRFFYL